MRRAPPGYARPLSCAGCRSADWRLAGGRSAGWRPLGGTLSGALGGTRILRVVLHLTHVVLATVDLLEAANVQPSVAPHLVRGDGVRGEGWGVEGGDGGVGGREGG